LARLSGGNPPFAHIGHDKRDPKNDAVLVAVLLLGEEARNLPRGWGAGAWCALKGKSFEIKPMTIPLKKVANQAAGSICAVLVFLIFPAVGWGQSGTAGADGDGKSRDLGSLDIEQLMDVKVTTASLFSDKISNAPSIISVVTSDELRRFGGMTLGEILQRVPGLTGTTQYFTDRSLVAALGDQTKTAGGHILFLINGRPTREVQEGGIISDLLESFPVGILERIEVIKGPGSVLYGSNAFSAVVNLITRKAQGAQVSAEGFGGPNGTVASDTQMLVKRGDFSAVGAAQLHDEPDWPLVYTVPPSERNLSFAPHVPNVQDVNLVDRGVGAYAGADYKGLSLMSAFTEWQSTAFVQGTVGETRLTRDFANLGYNVKVRQNWEMEFNVTYTRTTFGEVPYPSAQRDSNEFIAEWTNLITLTANDRLTVGTLFTRDAGTELFTGKPPAVAATRSIPGGSLYAQLDHQFGSKLKLIGGFQSNKISALAWNTVPRGGIIWNPSSWASIKALYGQAFRAPAIDETSLNRPGVVGNPTLVPEKVGTVNLGFGVQWNRLEGEIDYFNSQQTNDIVSVTGHPSHYENLGSITFNGVELAGKYYLNKKFFFQGSLLYQTNHNNTGKNDVTPIPNIGFKGGMSYESRGLTVSIFDVSDGPISGYSGAVNPLQGWHNNLNGHLRYDLSRYLPFGSENGVAIVAHVNNMFDHGIWLPGWGFNSIDTVPYQQGRVVFAGLQFTLGKH
jgi:outer membrane receptor for ferrienterochelin and colicin